MRRFATMRRFSLVAATVVALAVPASLATVAVAGSAYAGGSSITCKGLKGTITGTVTISKCTPTGGKGYKTASGAATSLASSGTLTWKSSKNTTDISGGTATQVTPVTCKGKTGAGGEYTFTATVSGGTASGPGTPQVGDAVSATACIGSTGKITLLTGTVMSL
jgi:hypothetical protein